MQAHVDIRPRVVGLRRPRLQLQRYVWAEHIGVALTNHTHVDAVADQLVTSRLCHPQGEIRLTHAIAKRTGIISTVTGIYCHNEIARGGGARRTQAPHPHCGRLQRGADGLDVLVAYRSRLGVARINCPRKAWEPQDGDQHQGYQ